MTVKRLIEELSKLDQKLPVYFFDGNEEFSRATYVNIVDYIEGSPRAVILTNWKR